MTHEPPPIRPAEPRQDPAAADLDTLVDMGLAEPPPEPQPLQAPETEPPA